MADLSGHIFPSSESPDVIILDGALATELERKSGNTLDTPLWSADMLMTNPSLIKQVHLDYYLAGSDVAITASYQASVQGLVQHRGVTEEEALDLIRQSVEVAKSARDSASRYEFAAPFKRKRKLLIAGSVGPYGAYLSDGSEYTGSYNLSSAQMKAFHSGRIKALVEADVDLLAIETQPSIDEIRAVLELLTDEFPQAEAWVSCTLCNDEEAVPTLSDGTSLQKLCELVNTVPQVVAVGVNCCPKNIVTAALREMRKWTVKPLVAYPNSGESWDAESKTWKSNGNVQKTWHQFTEQWIAEGARLIGGCCRTSPGDILSLRRSTYPGSGFH